MDVTVTKQFHITLEDTEAARLSDEIQLLKDGAMVSNDAVINKIQKALEAAE